MNKEQIVHEIIDNGIVCIIRTADDEHIPYIVEALYKGGVTFIEITSNTPNALRWIKEISDHAKEDLTIGAGTIVDGKMARTYIDVGSRFLVTPFTRKEIIKEANDAEIPVLSGAMTPGEIAEAHSLGADMVKIFPAEIFGPQYVKAVKAPLDYVRLVPTGGVSRENVKDWIRAGADALGVGSALFTKKMLEDKTYDLITENAAALIAGVKEARKEL